MRSFVLPFLLAFLSANAAPALERTSLVRRQNNPISRPVEVTTVTTTETPVGVIVQTCNVKLTPVTSPGGQTAVREDKVCRVEVQNGVGRGGNNNNNNNLQFSSTTTTTVTSTTTVRPPPTPPPPPPPPFVPPAAPTPPPQALPPPPPPALGGPVANPTEIGVIGTQPLLGQPPSPTIVGPLPPALNVNPPGVIVMGPSMATTIPDVNATAAAAQESPGFVIPGQRLQVLPIGLGVFAGISVIALIVVGLVTYERTKYRKTFRARKLAETAQPMGYGGMAER